MIPLLYLGYQLDAFDVSLHCLAAPNFYRPWMLATLAALASAAVLLSASIGIALQQMKQSESEQMNAQGERFLDRLEQVFGQLREG